MKTTTITGLRVGQITLLMLGVAFVVLQAGCRHEVPAEPTVRYNYPLMSPGTEFGELPPAVQRTVRAETGGAQIADIEKGSHGSQVVYRIRFQNAALFPPLYVAPDGSVLKPDLTVAIPAPHEVAAIKTSGPIERLTLQDLPPQVVKTIQSLAPDAEVSSIVRENKGDKAVYVVSFKDRMHPVLYVAPDGTLIREERQ